MIISAFNTTKPLTGNYLKTIISSIFILLLTQATGYSAKAQGSESTFTYEFNDRDLVKVRHRLATSDIFNKLSFDTDKPDPSEILAIKQTIEKNEEKANAKIHKIKNSFRKSEGWGQIGYGAVVFSVTAFTMWCTGIRGIGTLAKLKSSEVTFVQSVAGSVLASNAKFVFGIPFLAKGIEIFSSELGSIPEEKLLVKYLKHKMFLPSEVQTTIEDLFLVQWESKDESLIDKIRAVLDAALAIPYASKQLTYNRKYIYSKLKNYDDSVKKKLNRFAYDEIARYDFVLQPPVSFARYFYGRPGTGKTYAANQLAKGMGTQIATVSFDGATVEDIIGTSLKNPSPKPGILLEALMKLAKNDELPFTNNILFIDEFDRLLLRNDANANSILTMFLKVLDPKNRSFFSPYLNATVKLPDTIILAGNFKLKNQGEERPLLDALSSRLSNVEFPAFSSEAKEAILFDSFIPAQIEAYNSGKSGYGFQDGKLPQKEGEEIKEFIRNDSDPGLRSALKFSSDVIADSFQSNDIFFDAEDYL